MPPSLRILLLLLAALARYDATDTTPPAITIVYLQPYITHLLLTVTLNEDGTAYCGALQGTGTYTPSAYQLRTGTGLAGQGSSTVAAGTQVQVIVSGLMPGTIYEVYCYAEDIFANGMTATAVEATRRTPVVTASGGDYVWPTLAYVAPYEIIANVAITVYVQLSEDGTVWCVAKQDHGSGTTTPTAAEIRNNQNVDSWATSAIEAQYNYETGLRLGGLLEGTTYDVYCFAVDMSGNGIDRSPSWTVDATAIDGTKRAGITTLQVYRATRFRVSSDGGAVVDEYQAEPATWNLGLPRSVSSGTQHRYNLESWRAPLSLADALMVDQTGAAAGGCSKLPAAPPRGGPRVAILRRGQCTFSEKASRAYRAGYDAIVVIDHQTAPYLGVLPEMTAARDHEMEIPGWMISKATGDALLLTLSTAPATATTGGLPSLDVEDIRRKPRLSNYQSDIFGPRQYALH